MIEENGFSRVWPVFTDRSMPLRLMPQESLTLLATLGVSLWD